MSLRGSAIAEAISSLIVQEIASQKRLTMTRQKWKGFNLRFTQPALSHLGAFQI